MAGSAKAAPRGASDRKRRSLAVRAFVFMSRLFEYECRDLDVSLAQYRLLLYLRHGPKRAGELAAQASITRPSLSTLISTLERKGLTRRIAVDADKRGVGLELTPRGLRAIDEAEARFGEILDDATRDCDRTLLLDALAELAIVLSAQLESRVRADD
jgi:DNA-binding MarR family transcriptional regulator